MAEFTEKELQGWRKEYAGNCTDTQFDLWIEMCNRRGLVPVEDVVIQIRNVREYDEETKAKIYKRKAVYITTIRAFLKLAERTGKYKGFVESEYIYLDPNGYPTVASKVPLPDVTNQDKPKIPWAARVGVKRAGFDDAQYAVARFHAYAQSYESDGKKVLNSTWATRGPEQLVKCAKAAVLREAFPEELGGLYLHEEFEHDEPPVPATLPSVTPGPPVPPVTVAPKIDHTPAEGTVAPRPGETKEELPGRPPYTPELTLQDRQEHAKQQQDALNSLTSPEAAKKPDKKADKQPDKKAVAKRGRTRLISHIEEVPTSPQSVEQPAIQPDTRGEIHKVLDVFRTDRLPSEAEFTEIVTRIVALRDKVGGSQSPGSKQLRAFILKSSGKADTKEITVGEYLAIFKVLEGALDDKDLLDIISK